MRICDVPQYLRCGAYFTSLTENSVEEEQIPIPKDCIKTNEVVESVADFYLYMKSLRFWLVSNVPDHLVEVVLKEGAALATVLEEFSVDFPYLSDLATICSAPTNRKRMKTAASLGCLFALKYFLISVNSSELTKDLCESAAKNGHLACLSYLREQGCPWDEHTCTVAAATGHLSCLQYAHANGCRMTSEVCLAAAQNNHLDCLRYAHQQRCEWNKVVCAAAVLGNSLQCLQFAHEAGCPWDSHVCQIAASRGHLACLQYALSQGCPWDTNTTKAAAENGHFDCLQLAHQHGCFIVKVACNIDPTASEGHRLCCQYVAQHGF